MNDLDLKSMPGREQSEDPGKVNKNIINKGLNLFWNTSCCKFAQIKAISWNQRS